MQEPAGFGEKTNVFGLAFVVAWSAALLATVSIVGPFPATRRQAVMVVVGIALTIPDLVVRYRQSQEGFVRRFFSDIHGGAVAYIPAWILMLLLSTLATFFWLNER